jgi:hypothetical protein
METPHKGVLLGTLVSTIKLEQEQDTSWPNHSQEWGTPLGMETVLTTWRDCIHKMAEKACVYVYVYLYTYTYMYIHMCIIYRQDTSCEHKPSHKHLYHQVLKWVFERRWTLCCYFKNIKDWGGVRASTMVRKAPGIWQGPPQCCSGPALNLHCLELSGTKCPFYHLPGARFADRALDILTNISLVQGLQRVYQGTKDG